MSKEAYVTTRNVNHDNESYAPDMRIDLEDKHAKPLLERGAIRPAEKEAAPPKEAARSSAAAAGAKK